MAVLSIAFWTWGEEKQHGWTEDTFNVMVAKKQSKRKGTIGKGPGPDLVLKVPPP